MNSNCVEFTDVVDSTKMKGIINNSTSSKKVSDSKYDLFSNILNTAKDNKKAANKDESNNSCNNNSNRNANNDKIKLNRQTLKSKKSSYADDTEEISERTLLSDDENKLELYDNLLSILNGLLDSLLIMNDANIDTENDNIEGVNIKQETNLLKLLSNLVDSAKDNLDVINRDQLIQIKKISSELLNNQSIINKEELVEIIEELLSLTKGKEIIELSSDISTLNEINSNIFSQIKDNSSNNTLNNQDKNIGEVVVETGYSVENDDKTESNKSSSADEQGLNHSNEFKLLYNVLNNETKTIDEGNGFVDKFGKIDYNHFKADSYDVENLFKEVAEKTKFILKEKGSEVQIQLKPEILGKMVLKMSLEKGEMHAKAIVDNTQAKQLIDNNLIHLKETLKEQGIEVKTFEVFVGKDPNFSNRERNYWADKSKLKLKKASISIDEYDDVNAYYVNMFDNNSNTVLFHTTNFDIKA